MKIKAIILNVLFIIILICLIYFFIYLNNSNFENFMSESDNPFKNPALDDNKYNTNPVGTVNIPSINNNNFSPIPIDAKEKLSNGFTFDNPLMSVNFAYSLADVYNSKLQNYETEIEFKDGYYWILIPNIGPKYIYCIMDKKYNGGGWMLAMRSVYGSRNFSYESKHFKTSTVLNDDSKTIQKIIDDNKLRAPDFSISSIGEKIYDSNIDPNQYDAKFSTFNNSVATEWMAIFYVKNSNGNKIIGGDQIKENDRGWIWYEKNVKSDEGELVTPLELFNKLNQNDRELTKYYNNKYALNLSKFIKERKKPYDQNEQQIFSSQPISEKSVNYYGINYNKARSYSKMRWGFNFNDADDGTNDAFGGIGSSYTINETNNQDGFSAGNFEIKGDDSKFLDRPSDKTLRNRSFAVEWYVREK